MHRGFSIVLLVLVHVVSDVLGCSVLEPGARAYETGDEFETDDRKVYYTEVIVYGEVLGEVVGNYPFDGINGVFTVEFKVLCTYKGGPVPKTIFIAGMGNENGQIEKCPPAPKSGTTEKIMFLKRTSENNVFEIEFTPNSGDPFQMLDDFAINCNISLSEDSDKFCEDFVFEFEDEDECLSWTPIPPLSTVEPDVKPTPKPTPKSTPKTDSGERQPEPTSKPNKPVVDINGADNNNNNPSDEAYETKNDKDTSPAKSTDDVNGSTVVSVSLLATLFSIILTLAV